jgi:hypothetical protein
MLVATHVPVAIVAPGVIHVMSVERKSLAVARAVPRSRLAPEYARETTWLSRPLESVYLDPFAEVRSLWSLLFPRNEEPLPRGGSRAGQTRGQRPKGLQSGFAEDW